MFKTISFVAFVLCIAIGGGGASLWYALQARDGVGAITVGGWTAFPDLGTPDADPYLRARVARDGILALGRAEGLQFTAQRDSGGEALRRECQYNLEGQAPAARFWTLYAMDAAGAVLKSGKARPPALQSYDMLRLADNSVQVAIGPSPVPGNWLASEGAGAMSLVLTLYDTPVTGSGGMTDIQLPQLFKTGCDA